MAKEFTPENLQARLLAESFLSPYINVFQCHTSTVENRTDVNLSEDRYLPEDYPSWAEIQVQMSEHLQKFIDTKNSEDYRTMFEYMHHINEMSVDLLYKNFYPHLMNRAVMFLRLATTAHRREGIANGEEFGKSFELLTRDINSTDRKVNIVNLIFSSHVLGVRLQNVRHLTQATVVELVQHLSNKMLSHNTTKASVYSEYDVFHTILNSQQVSNAVLDGDLSLDTVTEICENRNRSMRLTWNLLDNLLEAVAERELAEVMETGKIRAFSRSIPQHIFNHFYVSPDAKTVFKNVLMTTSNFTDAFSMKQFTFSILSQVVSTESDHYAVRTAANLMRDKFMKEAEARGEDFSNMPEDWLDRMLGTEVKGGGF